ncbi:hypothetical protein LCGC14_2776560, partial [marine sediment metagenome]
KQITTDAPEFINYNMCGISVLTGDSNTESINGNFIRVSNYLLF